VQLWSAAAFEFKIQIFVAWFGKAAQHRLTSAFILAELFAPNQTLGCMVERRQSAADIFRGYDWT
jgi:hypothetical protein